MKNKQEQGQIFVLLVISIVGLLAIVGLGVDSARIFIEKRRVQNAVDNASLAGSLALCSGASSTTARANAIAVLTSYGYTDPLLYSVANPFDDDGDGINSTGQTDDDFVFGVTLTSLVDPIIIQIVFQGDVAATAEGIAYCKLVQEAVFAHALYTTGSSDMNCDPNSLKISGSAGSITGGFHSNTEIQIQSEILLDGNSSYVSGGFDDSKITYAGSTTFTQVAEKNPAMPYFIEDFAAVATAGGSTITDSYGTVRNFYNMGSGTVNLGDFESAGHYNSSTYAIDDGVYFVNGNFKLEDVIIGNATFVATGEVTLKQNGVALDPYYDDLLMVFANTGGSKTCNKGISMSGSDNAFKGMLFAPFGEVSMAGSSNLTVTGLIVSLGISISGSNTTLIYDTIYEPPPPPTVGIIK